MIKIEEMRANSIRIKNRNRFEMMIYEKYFKIRTGGIFGVVQWSPHISRLQDLILNL